MGDLLTRLRVGDVSRAIAPVPRLLEDGRQSLTLEQVCLRGGGMILGEGDTGKTTYAKMLAQAAASQGPVRLVPLRRRQYDFSLPPLGDGETATVVLDGLDEFPECARDVVDAYEAVDPDRCHVWVTSRACDAAAIVCESPRFAHIFRLEPFSDDDVLRIAAAAGLDGAAFLASVARLGFEHFLDKPGSAVVLLQLFADGRLGEASTVADLMNLIAERLAAETRDGHERAQDECRLPAPRLMAAAEWIAACLEFGLRQCVWTGPEHGAKRYDLPYRRLLQPGVARDALDEVIRRRLFEPLDPKRLRFAYLGMTAYLSGRWLAAHADAEQVEKGKLAPFRSESIAWASCFRPELGLSLVARMPSCFCRCHELIRRFGFARFLDAFAVRYWRDVDMSPPDGRFVWYLRGLSGFRDFAAFLAGEVRRPDVTDRRRIVALLLLKYCSVASETDAADVRSQLDAVLEPHVRECFAVATDKPEPDAAPRFRGELPGEREVAEMLRRSESRFTLARVLRAQAARALPYRALARHFEERFASGGPGMFAHRELLAVAIQESPGTYLPRVVRASDREKAIAFLTWMCRHKHLRTLEAAAWSVDADCAAALAALTQGARLQGLASVHAIARHKVDLSQMQRPSDDTWDDVILSPEQLGDMAAPKDAPAPTRGKPSAAGGSRRGSKNTTHMQLQRSALKAYADELQVVVAELSVQDCVNLWNRPENKPDWDAWSRRRDGSRGYKSPQCLLNCTKAADLRGRRNRSGVFSVR